MFRKESQNGSDADFDCMPMNMDVLDAAEASTSLQGGISSSMLASSFHARRMVDCKMWNPDMPEMLGLYHAYVRGYNKDIRLGWWLHVSSQRINEISLTKVHAHRRTHKLFIITSGGCCNLSDKFYNCFVDIKGSSMTVDEVLESEEAYYLRRINGRWQ